MKSAPGSRRRLIDDVARKVLEETLGMKAGEAITIETWNNGLEFASRAALRARESGANPVLLLEDEESYIEGVRRSPKGSIGRMGKHEYALLSSTDAYLFVPGPLLGGSPRLSREEIAGATAYNSSWYEAAEKGKLRGARMTFGYVGEEMSELLGKPVDELVDHQLKASLVESRKLREGARKLKGAMKKGGKLVLSAEGTELSFELADGSEVQDGVVDRDDVAAGNNMANMPGGYLLRRIAPGSLAGRARLHAPIVREGAIMDVGLVFSDGKLVSWKCRGHQDWIDGLVGRAPEGRRAFSSLLVGLNPHVRPGYGQDRLVRGGLTLAGLFQGTVESGSLDAGGKTVVEGGRLRA
jgi:leucyl aminopeptidase (aminopeptidase T)